MDIKSFIFLNFFCLLILCFNPFVEGDAAYGLCANNECSNPISRGVTIIRYASPDDNRISFEPNEEVQIYVKDYGPKKDLWGVVVKGTRGYISKSFIRETKQFAKELVPAFFEFRSSILVPGSTPVSNNLHVSSNFHPSDVVSQSIQHTQNHNLMSSAPNSFQQQNNFVDRASQQQAHHTHPSDINLMSSAPNSVQQQPNFVDRASQQQSLINSVSNSFQQQAQHTHTPDFNSISSEPNSFQPQNNFVDSASQQQNRINSASNNFPQHAQHTHQSDYNLMNSAPSSLHQQQDFTNLPPGSSQLKWNNPSENQMHHPRHSINPSSNPNLHPQFHQSPHIPVVPEQSSHFNIPLENDFNSLEMTDMLSQGILQSSTHGPYVHSPTKHHFPNDPVMTSLYEDLASNMPNFPGNGHFNPNVAGTSRFQNPHQHSLNEQLQTLHTTHAQGIHPSADLSDYIDDYSRTIALLSSMGLESPEMYANQEVHANPSSQNTERNFGINAAEIDSISSQSQHPSHENSDTIMFSSIDPTLHLKENKIVNLDNQKELSDGVYSETVNDASAEDMNDATMNIVNEDNSKEENTESEALSEENIEDDDNNNDEEEEEEEADDDDESDSSVFDEFSLSTKNVDSIRDQLNIQSSSSPEMNLQSSEGNLGTSEDSIHESSTLNMPTEEHSTVIQREQLDMSVDAHSILSSTVTYLSSMVESIFASKPESVDNFEQNSIDKTAGHLNTINPNVDNIEALQEKQVNVPNVFSEGLSESIDRNNNDALTSENGVYKKEYTTPKISDFFVENEKIAEVEQILSPMDIDGLGEDLTTYQNRNLKGEYGTTDDPLSDSEGTNDENNTQSESDSYSSYGNWFDALRAAMDFIISWIPEPLYSTLMDLSNKGLSPRVPVFTAVSGFMIIFFIVPLYYIKERSKESKLIAQLIQVEKRAFNFTAMNAVLEDKLETAQNEVVSLQTSLAEEKSLSESLRTEFENQAEELENTKAELESCLEVIDSLKEKENEYLTLINDYEKKKEYYSEHKESLDKIMKEQESSIEYLTSQLQESENKVQELETEKEQFLLIKTDYEDKLAHFDRNCNQLLQEAEVWNTRVKELTENVDLEVSIKEELVESIKAKDEEIESLKELVETFKIFDEIEDPDEQAKSKEEKLQSLLNSIMITNQLKKEEEKSKLLDEQLQQEKNKILELEVELLESKSEIDKLKLNYNQALQDKAEAQTKLEVLTNYFKDKEIQLQRQLGAQEADRQKKEENVNSAERRIMLIEQENTSYKSQVASMKQEMEETERTLRSQIAAQEKKAHENWIAARAAERNLENMKQEVTQLRQRLTLLEREQETWANAASREEIIRPVPKRIPGGVNEEPGRQETSERGMFPPPHMPLPPMMLPPDRPLPPLPPPPMPPMFLPPPPPHMERHFRPQPWHIPPDHSSDYRTTPPEFMGGRELTPPRGRPTNVDGDTAPHTSSPMTTDTRDSRNSTPPHLLPDFHDIPPQPGRPFFPPPGGRPRFSMHPPYRRDAGPEPKRLDNQNESNSRGPPHPPASEQWQHSRV